MENNYFEEEKYIRAQKKLKKIKGFYWHLFWYLVVNIFIIGSIYVTSKTNEDFFKLGHFFTLLSWGIGLLAHGLTVFGKNIFFSKDWEERKVKEYMEKDRFN